jgi:sugar/nucleoside kinase (ribokinase family)
MSLGVVVVGSVALDTLELGGKVYEDVLGGSASFFSIAAAHFAKPSLVAVVGEDFPSQHRAYLSERGIDITGLSSAHGKTFRWRGRYSDDLQSRTSLDTQLNVFADFKPVLPPSYRKAELLFLGNIHPALQLDVLDQVEKPRLVAMDTMNFWIGGELPALKKVLERVDTVILNDEEARQLSGEHNLPKAARAIHAMGPRTVIVKRGDAGALLFYWENGKQGVFAAPAYPLEQVVDPTGAGDTFAGGFMGSLARTGAFDAGAIRRAMFHGSVMASFCVEGIAHDRLRTVTMPEIEARYTAFCDLTHFEQLHL